MEDQTLLTTGHSRVLCSDVTCGSVTLLPAGYLTREYLGEGAD